MMYSKSHSVNWCAAVAFAFMIKFAVGADAVWINAGFNDLGQNQIVNFSEVVKVEMGKDASGTKDLARLCALVPSAETNS